MKVFTVIVFESGDMTTKVWGVFNTLEKAEKYKEEILSNKELNNDDCYLNVSISEHKLQ